MSEERQDVPPSPEMRDTGLLARDPREMWATVRLDVLSDAEFERVVTELCREVSPTAAALPAQEVLAGKYGVQAHLLVDGSQVTSEERAHELGLVRFTVPGGTWAEIEICDGDDPGAVYRRLEEDLRLMGCTPGEFFYEELSAGDAGGRRHVAVEMLKR